MDKEEWSADWSNEFTLEFLEAYKNEPCIWHPKHSDYKNKCEVLHAWDRISDSLSVPVKELKRKRESLMACWRIHVNKTKSSIASGRIYKTNWFAYELMSSFLHPLYFNDDMKYDGNVTLTFEAEDDQNVIYEETSDVPLLYTIKKSPKRRCSDDYTPDPLSSHYNSKTKKSRSQEPKQPHRSVSPSSFNMFKQETRSSFQKIKSEVQKLATQDESQMFANFLAVRLRKFGEFERARLINDIENLMYQAKKRDFAENEGNDSQRFSNEAGSTSKENVDQMYD